MNQWQDYSDMKYEISQMQHILFTPNTYFLTYTVTTQPKVGPVFWKTKQTNKLIVSWECLVSITRAKLVPKISDCYSKIVEYVR